MIDLIYYAAGAVSGCLATLGFLWAVRQPAVPVTRREITRHHGAKLNLDDTRPNRRRTPTAVADFDEGNTHP